MTFQNAYHGVKKIFTAELLKLIGGACALIAAILLLVTAGAAVAGSEGGFVASGLGSMVLLAAAVVLPIIGFIMNLVGLRQAGNDEENFHTAFIISIFALIIRVVSGIFTMLNVGGGVADNIATSVSRICEIVVFVLVVFGVTNLADRLHKSEILGTASTLITFYLIAFGIAIILDIVVLFFGNGENLMKIEGIMGIVSAICSIIAYIIYLVFLGKAKKLLREN